MSCGIFLFLIASLTAIKGVLLISCCTWYCVEYCWDKKVHEQSHKGAANREAGGEVPLVPIQPGIKDIPTSLVKGRMGFGGCHAGTARDQQLFFEAAYEIDGSRR